MSDFKYEFRVLMEDTNGTTYAYGSSSLVSMAANTSKVVTTEQMLESINLMPSMSFYNAPSFTTSSTALFNDNYDSNPDSKVLKISSLLYYQSQSFGPSSRGGGFGTQNPTIHTDYQFLSCSIKDHALSGSIIFHTNTTPHPTQGTTLKRYKFWGSKVCQVLGVPENYWIYSDKFRLSNTGSEQNYLSGDVLATSLNLKTNFAINNAGSITSDLPFRHFKESDRYVRWTDISSSIPVNRMLVGYNQHRDEYGIEMPSDDSLILSASSVSASGDFEINGKLTIGGDMVNTNGNPVVFSNETGSFHQNITAGPTGLPGATVNNSLAAGHITASGNISASKVITAASMSIGPGDDFSSGKALHIEGDVTMSGNLFLKSPGSVYVGGTENDNSDNRFRFHHNATDGYIDVRNTADRAGNINFRGLTYDGSVNYNTFLTLNADSNDITSSGVFYGKTPGYFRVGGYNFIENRWLAWGGGIAITAYQDMGEDEDTDFQLQRCVMPFDGYIQHITLKPKTSAGNTNVRFFKVTGTELAENLDNEDTQVGNTLTLDLSTAGLPQTARYGPGASFSRGDVLGVKVDPTTNPYSLDGILVLMFDVENVPSDHI